MEQAVFSWEDFDEGSERLDRFHDTVIHFPNFWNSNDSAHLGFSGLKVFFVC